jgi:hypothetical protein
MYWSQCWIRVRVGKKVLFKMRATAQVSEKPEIFEIFQG